MPSLDAYLDLPLAWRRTKRDLTGRAFLDHSLETDLIELDLNGWLEAVRGQLAAGHYHPQPLVISDVPKRGGLVRPGADPALVDRLVYTACVGHCYPEIHTKLQWSQGTIDYSYQFTPKPASGIWLKDPFTGWKNFNQKVLSVAESGTYSHVVFTDLTGFYECVSLELLSSDLRALGVERTVVNQMGEMLNYWALATSRGIPQGLSASDILAKLYLNPIDEALALASIPHVRYVDDIRIFCRSLDEAKSAVLFLTRLLRKRGLHLQSAKTQIVPAADVRQKIRPQVEAMRAMVSNFVDEVAAAFDWSGYLSVAQADRLISEQPHQAPQQMVEQAYHDQFGPAAPPFDAGVFHFLLRRLGNQGSTVPLDLGVLDFLASEPQETATVLEYIRRVGKVAEVQEQLIDFLKSPSAIYPYQRTQILTFLAAELSPVNDHTLEYARRAAQDSELPVHGRGAARALVGRSGLDADLDFLERLYPSAVSDLERAYLVRALRLMESSRRNALFGRWQRDGELVRRAVSFSRGDGE